ncbi:MAG: hypothetical protein U0P46_08655 [Holophagaceae bacterium]
MNTITYQKGTDKKHRATFICGKAAIPAAMVSRVLKAIDGMSDSLKVRTFIAKLAPKHGAFFDAMEKAGINELQAITLMASLTPAKEKATPRISKEASAVAKMLCRKYAKKTPEDMFSAFSETMSRPEFKVLVIELVSESEKKFGRNAQERIRIRPERKDLVRNAEKARAGRGKTK